MSERTVRAHFKQATAKQGIGNRVMATALAVAVLWHAVRVPVCGCGGGELV
ncbi:MAG: hypothetical protein ABIZ70_00565 [Gemmatimonadales bacterium]